MRKQSIEQRLAALETFFNGFRKDSRRGFQGDKGDKGADGRDGRDGRDGKSYERTAAHVLADKVYDLLVILEARQQVAKSEPSAEADAAVAEADAAHKAAVKELAAYDLSKV